MPRLIDADRFKNWLMENYVLYDGCRSLKDIDAQPTVDAVSVVRCKDCKFSSMPEWDSDEVYCTKHDNWFKFNGYCHLGMKKDAKID